MLKLALLRINACPKTWGPALACLPLAFATSLVAEPHSSPLTERTMASVRGADPMHQKRSEGSCTRINVENLNTFDPPGGPPTAVAYSDCRLGLSSTTICIACRNNVNSYYEEEIVGPPGYSGTAVAVDCGPDGGGTQGRCVATSGGYAICVDTQSYDCNIFGIDYAPQN